MTEENRFLSLMQVIEKAREKHPGYSKRMDEALAMSRWEASVGKVIAKHARAATIKNGILWVEVDHPVWRAELHHRKNQILKRLNEDGNDSIRDIFLVDPRRKPSAKRLFVQKLQKGKK